jgi:hypothetical protein
MLKKYRIWKYFQKGLSRNLANNDMHAPDIMIGTPLLKSTLCTCINSTKRSFRNLPILELL